MFLVDRKKQRSGASYFHWQTMWIFLLFYLFLNIYFVLRIIFFMNGTNDCFKRTYRNLVEWKISAKNKNVENKNEK